ncbi:response regulator [Endozoicomonas sp. SM1973]|uniref:Transcriptional regulatory protein n=1 Tax=Spartinivicinus marinus TaxID=2994442 RepID=A0A853I3W8_9GAMM|nr:response regulator [Spartinivicinus marinus]MCX4030094.1 response regulator [Spartinivicinus marinus]NYZ64661.1 response regulator [Spartinivicinus marinus]
MAALISVVIVEDDPDIAEIQRLFVEKINGFEVVGIAYNLADAKSLVSVLKPQLVLLDVYFPDGSGLSFLQQLRTEEAKSDVILITAAKDITTLQTALRGGVVDYIIKPVIFERFAEALQKYQSYWCQLNQLEQLQQTDIDQLITPAMPVETKRRVLPKGLQKPTLEKVQNVFKEPDVILNAEQVGERIGISRTTARRYLEYLVSCRQLQCSLVYGDVGRPERRYSMP